MRPFSQVDVFATSTASGNPVAVVHDAEGLSDRQMQAFANWTNLAETTFLFPPSQSGSDFRIRIFTPEHEIPFAGHPTLGAAHAWEERGGCSSNVNEIVQECCIGKVKLKRIEGELAFRAPELLRSGEVDKQTLHRTLCALGISSAAIQHSNWVDNGPGWLGLLLQSAEQVLALRPNFQLMSNLNIGVIGPYEHDGPADFEVRAFVPVQRVPEDPVSGSLNAGFAKWLIRAGLAPMTYTVRQGTVLGRHGHIIVRAEDDCNIWIAGCCKTLIHGTADI